MKVFTVTGFKGYYPTGTSAVVVAKNRDDAVELIMAELKRIGLEQYYVPNIEELNTRDRSVTILTDGDY